MIFSRETKQHNRRDAQSSLWFLNRKSLSNLETRTFKPCSSSACESYPYAFCKHKASTTKNECTPKMSSADPLNVQQWTNTPCWPYGRAPNRKWQEHVWPLTRARLCRSNQIVPELGKRSWLSSGHFFHFRVIGFSGRRSRKNTKTKQKAATDLSDPNDTTGGRVGKAGGGYSCQQWEAGYFYRIQRLQYNSFAKLAML